MNIDDAIAHEEQGLAMYMEFANKFQNPVFSEILSVKPMGVNILKQSKQVENSKEDDKNQSKNYSIFDFSYIDDEKDAIYTALSYEAKSESLYKNLASKEKDETLKDTYFRIWATSTNEYKVALKSSLKNEDINDKQSYQNDKFNKHINPNDMGFNFKEVNELKATFDKFKQGTATTEDALNLLNNPATSFISGALAGAVCGVLLNQILNKNKENK